MNIAIETLQKKSTQLVSRIAKLDDDIKAPAAIRMIEIQKEAIDLVKSSDLTDKSISQKLSEMQIEDRKMRALFKRQNSGKMLDLRIELGRQLDQINNAISILTFRQGQM